jgi:hypothetical protein
VRVWVCRFERLTENARTRRRFTAAVRVIGDEAREVEHLEELTGSTITKFPELEDAKHAIEGLDEVLALRRLVEDSISGWLETRWVDTDLSKLERVVVQHLSKADKLRDGVLDWNVTKGLLGMLSSLYKAIPLLVLLRSKSMRSRHWKQVLRVVGRELETNTSSVQEYTLQELVLLRPGDFADEFRAIVVQVWMHPMTPGIPFEPLWPVCSRYTTPIYLAAIIALAHYFLPISRLAINW